MKRLLIIMAFAALVISCSKEEEIKASVEITGGNELLFAGNDTIAKIICFTASHQWNASSNAHWCHIQTKSGESGSACINVAADKNNTGEKRVANITISSKDACAVATVTQEFVYETVLQRDTLIIDNDVIEKNANRQKFEINVRTNIAFDATTSDEWITVETEKTKGITITKLQILLEELNGFEPRMGTINLESDEISRKIQIIQHPWQQRWQISYLHNKVELKSPLFNGNYIGGDIDWGDGNTEDFKEGVPYKYSNNCEKITTFNIHGTKINSIKIPSIHSIKSIKIVRNLEKQ